MAEKGVETSTGGGGGEAQKKVLTMKIVRDKKSNKLLYGEASKEMVDFLLYLLTLPIGSVVKLLEDSDTGMVGCAVKLYNSVRTIDASYLHNDEDRNQMLLNLTSSQYSPANPATSHLLLEHKSSGTTTKKYYQCPSYQRHIPPHYFSDLHKAYCPKCCKPMTEQVTFVEGKNTNDDENERVGGGGGIVKGAVTYMVMDDLSITPLTTNAVISIFNEFSVVIKDVEERTAEIGMEEGLKLLKASLQSKTALSDVFIVKKGTDVSPATRKRKSVEERS